MANLYLQLGSKNSSLPEVLSTNRNVANLAALHDEIRKEVVGVMDLRKCIQSHVLSVDRMPWCLSVPGEIDQYIVVIASARIGPAEANSDTT